IIVIALSCAMCIAACDDSDSGCKHVMETINEVEATCVQDGNIKYYHCSVCDKYFEDEQGVFSVNDLSETVTTNPDNPDYDTVIESADCENNGAKKLVCRRNSEHVHILGTIPAIGHSIVTGGKCETCDKQIATAGLEYTLSEYGEQYFVSSGSASGKIIVPGNYNGKPVIISEGAFTGKDNITEVTVLKGVQKIYNDAFNNCVNLAALNLPASIDYISDGAFTGCNALVSINVDEANYKYAGVDGSLIDKQYNSLIFGARDGVIPGGYELIGIASYAFEGSAIQSIVIPAGIETINRSAFKDCAELTSVTISSDVQFMADRAFYGCAALKGVYINDIAAWCKIEFQSEANPLENRCPLYVNNQPLAKFTASGDIEAISDYAFSGCTSITEVSLGSSVKSIGSSAFAKCVNLTYVGCSD
ncbi:MAG: leucine-rich repeat domain-containing protein, partial [Clostridia bacterium]|nr:leucine-rich repeat domain-containing protein [Clostridia bacterium]